MRSFSNQRRRRNHLRFSAMGKKSQEVQAAKRAATLTPDDLLDLAANPPPRPGDPIRVLEWRNLQTGTILRWSVLRGPRSNNYLLRTPDGRTSQPHGLAWLLDHLRHILLTH